MRRSWCTAIGKILTMRRSVLRMGPLVFAGQSCISVQRVFVERNIFQTFVWKVVDVAEKMVIGDPSKEETELGPMIRQSEAERVEAWVKEAVKGGAKAGDRRGAQGIHDRTGHSHRNQARHEVRDEEIFGPVLLIEPYDDFDEALAQVNHSKYGLQAGLLTRDSGRILTAYRELEVGAPDRGRHAKTGAWTQCLTAE